MVISKDNLEKYTFLLPKSKRVVSRNITLCDVEAVCRAVINTINSLQPSSCVEYDVDLFEPICYLYLDGDVLNEPELALLLKQAEGAV